MGRKKKRIPGFLLQNLLIIKDLNMFKTALSTILLILTFHSYAGEGHDAGEKWAEDNDITDTSDCGGNSSSFIEGCEDYVNQLNEEQEEAEQGEANY